jgi:UDP-2-acetamido-3-amino-2,3-dideoxy-glucuronate N-acetyltransferase
MIHKTAIIDRPCHIGKGTKIWHYAHVRENVHIGDDCMLGQGTYIDTNIEIGNRVRIQNGVSVYEGVTIEDNVFIGPGVIFTNCRNYQDFGCKIFTKTYIKSGAVIGAGAIIVCGVIVGRDSFIAAGSLVTKNVEDYEKVKGSPANGYGWIDRDGTYQQKAYRSNRKD